MLNTELHICEQTKYSYLLNLDSIWISNDNLSVLFRHLQNITLNSLLSLRMQSEQRRSQLIKNVLSLVT